MTLLIDTLTLQRYVDVKVDGEIGPITKKAISAKVRAEIPVAKNWDDKRLLVAVQQMYLTEMNFYTGGVDGFVGPLTLYAQELWQNYMRDINREEDPPVPPVWPRQQNVATFYGAMGKSQVLLELPFPMVLAWNQHAVINRFSINEKVAAGAERAFKAMLKEYGLNRLQALNLTLFGGCLNVRKMKGGSNWSMHSWGIAIDFDPEHNQLRWGRDRAAFARPEYKDFFSIWQEEGWIGLGPERNYDWMHIQAARL